MLMVGHRGSSWQAPENTRASFRLAWAEGCDAVEFDVHQTLDGRVAVIHDETLLRTTGCDRAVAELPMDELRRLDAGRWKSPAYAGEPIPELGEVLALGPAGARYFVEVKCGPEIIPLLRTVLEKRALGNYAPFVLLSFRLDVLRAAREAMPSVELLWNLEMKPREGGWQPSAEKLIRTMREYDVLSVGLGYCPGVTPELVRALQQAGRRVFVWTVDDPAAAIRLAAAGVDYLASNRPGWIRRQLRAPLSRG